MTRTLLAWLDRRIDARIEARELRRAEEATRIAEEARVFTRHALDRVDAARAREART